MDQSKIVESVLVPPDFFAESWHYHLSDGFCPQEQELSAYRLLQQNATLQGDSHIKQLEKNQAVGKSNLPPMQLRIPHKYVENANDANNGAANNSNNLHGEGQADNRLSSRAAPSRLLKKIPNAHEFEFGNLKHLQQVTNLYQQFMQDLAFCHRWRIIGGTLHPRYPGTLLVLVDAHESFKIPEFYPEERNYNTTACKITGNKIPDGGKDDFLQIHAYYEHEAELVIKSYKDNGLNVPSRLLWIDKLLKLQATVPTHQDQVATFGKAFLRMAFAMDSAEFEDKQALDVLKLMIL